MEELCNCTQPDRPVHFGGSGDEPLKFRDHWPER